MKLSYIYDAELMLRRVFIFGSSLGKNETALILFIKKPAEITWLARIKKENAFTV